jgi:hypothetical protein
MGSTAMASKTYTTSIDLDPATERYLYYVSGAHGGAYSDGSPLVQYDLKTKLRKVIAFLRPFYHKRYGFVPCGTAVSPKGDKVYITWVHITCNGNRESPVASGRFRFNTCAFTFPSPNESRRCQHRLTVS